MEDASKNNENVIVACHHPIGSGSARPTHMALNASDIEPILVQSGVVPLVLSGHDHPGGYVKIGPTHFLTAPGVIEGMFVCTVNSFSLGNQFAKRKHQLPRRSLLTYYWLTVLHRSGNTMIATPWFILSVFLALSLGTHTLVF